MIIGAYQLMTAIRSFLPTFSGNLIGGIEAGHVW
jgi:formate/nitrite transporter FocA (FNT family)